jgi:hypothetical protein
MFRTAIGIVFASGLLVALPNFGSAQQPLANAGTLTCTLAPGTEEKFGVERELSCSFQPLVGRKGRFVGVVKRLGAENPDRAKIVLHWSVRAPSTDIALRQLEGRYIGRLGSDSPDERPSLIGGKEGKIALQPLTVDPQLGINAAISILELELRGMKT